MAFAALVGGGWFPVAAKLANPFLAYGIVLVSFPLWALGAVAAGLVALAAWRREPGERRFLRWGVALSVANMVTAFAVLLLVPYHVS